MSKKSIYLYNFYRKKYGKELLVDVIDLQSIKNNIKKNPVHRLSYYDITFITDGEEEIFINESKYEAKPKDAITSIPGEVWQWNSNTTLNGYVLVFEEEFLLSFFNDPLFLQKLQFLHSERKKALISLDETTFLRITTLLKELRDEIKTNLDKDLHILRAMLYEILALLDRTYRKDNNENELDNKNSSRHINTFIQLVNTHYIHHRNTEFYADKLFITSNYLNKIVKQHFGLSPKEYILQKAYQEAKLLLTHTTLSINEITDKLHFSTASYFICSFKKHIGISPQKYRNQK